ncbi:SH3 domain-containing protein [Lamprobacter modestohalophilus]|uniref:SH3 domain-containing protein n=1 Tax=Lamprobacter modestohalophilus TaxID=1064514 RepID=UPI003D18CC4A
MQRLWSGLISGLISLGIATVLTFGYSTWAYSAGNVSVTVNTPGDGFLALRSEPTTKSGRRLVKIPHGTPIQLGTCLRDQGGNWCQTSYNGLSGWVFDRYVVPVGGVPSNPGNPRQMRGADRPVLVGGEPEYDACGGLGVVRGLKPGGDGFLALRSGPSAEARLVSKLREGDAVYLCDDVPGWIGVVVYPSSPLVDCGVGSPIIPRQPYSGACQTGWVSEKWIELVAG